MTGKQKAKSLRESVERSKRLLRKGQIKKYHGVSADVLKEVRPEKLVKIMTGIKQGTLRSFTADDFKEVSPIILTQIKTDGKTIKDTVKKWGKSDLKWASKQGGTVGFWADKELKNRAEFFTGRQVSEETGIVPIYGKDGKLKGYEDVVGKKSVQTQFGTDIEEFCSIL